METKLFQDLDPEAREAMLEANAHYSETQPVKKFFKEEDLIDMRREYSENSILIKRADEKMKIASELHKTETKKPKENNVYLLNNIRNGFVEVEQTVYVIADWENRIMGYYDRYGEFIRSRRMTPDERQTSIPK